MATYVEIDDEEVAPEAPITSSLMTRLRDNALAYLGAATGTIMISGTTSAPLGWSNLNDHADKAIRVVGSAATLSSGGSSPFSTVFAKTATDEKTLAQGNLPSYTLPDTLALSEVTITNGTVVWRGGNINSYTPPVAGGTNFITGATQANLELASTAISGSVTSGGSGNPFTVPIDLRVQYVDVKRIQKS